MALSTSQKTEVSDRMETEKVTLETDLAQPPPDPTCCPGSQRSCLSSTELFPVVRDMFIHRESCELEASADRFLQEHQFLHKAEKQESASWIVGFYGKLSSPPNSHLSGSSRKTPFEHRDSEHVIS